MGFISGTVFSALLHALIGLFKGLIQFIALIIFYFGLYVPIAYLVFGGILKLFFRFDLFDLSTDSLLFIFGLSLSFVCAIIISVKNLIVKPFRKYFKKTEIIEYKDDKKLSKDAPEAPIIYKSKVNKGIIVYEYSSRYDLYEECEDGLRLVDTEYKDKRAKRW